MTDFHVITNAQTGEVVEIPLTAEELAARIPPLSSRLKELADAYAADNLAMQQRWLAAALVGGTSEASKKAAVVSEIAARKSQYISDMAAVRAEYA